MTILIVLVSNSQSVLPASLEVGLAIVCVLAIAAAFRSEKKHVAAASAAYDSSTLPSGRQAQPRSGWEVRGELSSASCIAGGANDDGSAAA